MKLAFTSVSFHIQKKNQGPFLTNMKGNYLRNQIWTLRNL